MNIVKVEKVVVDTKRNAAKTSNQWIVLNTLLLIIPLLPQRFFLAACNIFYLTPPTRLVKHIHQLQGYISQLANLSRAGFLGWGFKERVPKNDLFTLSDYSNAAAWERRNGVKHCKGFKVN